MQTQGQQFEIHVQSNSSTAEEWQRAMQAPASASLNTDYRVAAVFYEGGKLRWIVRFETPHGTRSVGVASELADDLIDYELVDAVQQLKHKLNEAVSEQ